MKGYQAFVEHGASFYVTASAKETALAEARNVCAILFLEYGLQLRVSHIKELDHEDHRNVGCLNDGGVATGVAACVAGENEAGALELATVVA